MFNGLLNILFLRSASSGPLFIFSTGMSFSLSFFMYLRHKPSVAHFLSLPVACLFTFMIVSLMNSKFLIVMQSNVHIFYILLKKFFLPCNHENNHLCDFLQCVLFCLLFQDCNPLRADLDRWCEKEGLLVVYLFIHFSAHSQAQALK